MSERSEKAESVDSDLTARLRQVSTATLATALFKRGLRNQFIQGASRLGGAGGNMVGAAFTLRYIPAREDIDQVASFKDPTHPQRVAVETIPPGSVLVMDCRGDASAASAGGILLTRLQVRGCEGVVTDGGIRDSDYIAQLPIRTYTGSRSAPTNLTKHHAMDIGLPIGCGGVAIYPGDICVGDGDGVIVIPREIAAEIADEATSMERFEDWVIKEVEAGAPVIGTYPPDEATSARYDAWQRSIS